MVVDVLSLGAAMVGDEIKKDASARIMMKYFKGLNRVCDVFKMVLLWTRLGYLYCDR